MSHYEIMYIIPVKMGEDNTTEVQTKVQNMLKDNGAQITSEENLGKKKLAYPINHMRHGTYFVVECDLETQSVKPVSEWFRLSADILRAQIIAKEIKTPEQIARDKAWQSKLAKKQADAEAVEDTKTSALKAPEQKVSLDELDKKLEEILTKEMVN
ncbi:MAG: 30S ribosomal protein S6 [Patescibacteria group bacterium]